MWKRRNHMHYSMKIRPFIEIERVEREPFDVGPRVEIFELSGPPPSLERHFSPKIEIWDITKEGLQRAKRKQYKELL